MTSSGEPSTISCVSPTSNTTPTSALSNNSDIEVDFNSENMDIIANESKQNSSNTNEDLTKGSLPSSTKNLNPQDLLLAVLNQTHGSIFGQNLEPQTTKKQSDNNTVVNPTEALLPKITPYSHSLEINQSKKSDNTSETVKVENNLLVDSEAFISDKDDKKPKPNKTPEQTFETKSQPEVSSHTLKSQGFRLPKNNLKFDGNSFSTALHLDKTFDNSLLTKPKKTSEQPFCKHIVAHQGFFVFPLKGGKFIVNKEVPGVRLSIKDHKDCIVDLLIWEPSNSLDADSEERYLITIGLDSTLMVWNFKNINEKPSQITHSMQFGLQGTPKEGSPYRYKYVAWNPENVDIIAIATDSNEVLLLDLSTYMKPKETTLSSESEISNLINSFKTNQSITSLAFSPNGKLLTVGEANGGILVVEIDDNTACSLKVMPTSTSKPVDFLQFVSGASDSFLLIVGLDNQTEIQLWDMTTLSVIQTLYFSPSQNTICFEKNSQTLFLGNNSRNSLLAFHLSTSPEAYFDYVTEFVVKAELSSIFASQDILTSLKPITKRTINLYINQNDTRMIYFTPILTYLPDFSSCPSIPESYFYPVENSHSQSSPPSSSNSQKINRKQKDASDSKKSDALKEELNPTFESSKSKLDAASEQRNSESIPKLNSDSIESEPLDNSKAVPRSSKKDENIVKESSKPSSNNASNKKSSNNVSPSAPSSNSGNLNLLPDSPIIEADKTSSTTQISPQAMQKLSDDISTIKKGLSASSQQNIKEINKISAQVGTISKSIKTLPTNLSQSIRTEISPVFREMTSDFISKTLRTQLASSFLNFSSSKEFQAAVNSQVQKHAQEVLASDSFVQAISKSVTEQLVKSNQEHFARQIETVLIPAYQKSTATMFNQLHASFKESLEKHKKAYEEIISIQQKQYETLSALLSAYEPPSDPPQTVNSNKMPQKSPKSNLQSSSPPASQLPDPPAKPAKATRDNRIIPPSLTLEQELLEAIEKTNFKKVVEIFKESSPSAIFKYCEITQKNMLILAKIMTKEFSLDTPLKAAVIRECLNNISPQDPTISDHIDRFISTTRSNIKNLANNMAKIDPQNPLIPQLMSLVSSCTKLLSTK